MKLVLAIIQPPRLAAVLTALTKVGVERMSVFDSQGFGRQGGRTPMYRGHEYKTQFLRKVSLEILVNDDYLNRTIDTIENAARTGEEGQIGDGKVFVLPVDQVIQISDGSHGPQAV